LVHKQIRLKKILRKVWRRESRSQKKTGRKRTNRKPSPRKREILGVRESYVREKLINRRTSLSLMGEEEKRTCSKAKKVAS